MRIAHLISTFFPSVGGAEVCVHNLASEEARMGHTVKVIAPVKKSDLCPDYEILPLRKMSVFCAMMPSPFSLYFLRQIAAYQRRYGFDIWQVTIGYPFGTAALGFFKKNNIPCVLRCSGEDIQTEPDIGYGARLHRWPDLRIRKTYPRFDALISITKTITDEYIKMGVSKDKIYYIPNGVDKTFFDLSIDYNYNTKAVLGIDSRKKVIVSIGRNHPKKGFEMIPDIVRSLLKKRDDFIWLLIGKGNDKIGDIARERGVSKFIIIRGVNLSRQELAGIYKSSDLFVLPTLIEGCSNVVAEAMASGLPVVSTKAQGIEDMVEDGRTGLLCGKNDPADMARKIGLALDNGRIRAGLIRNGLEKTRGLNWGAIAARYIEVYERVIRDKKG